MTTQKRALIVDDSRSARVILSRMLEAYDLKVDAAESAEQALEYLRQNRPDVVFMDHLMPGMDGFQAIQAIKSNPDTATIPVMMYTSQEGELYVSQARALGAVGVLPKTVKPGDVSRVLYQLHLLPERREERTGLFESSEVPTLDRPSPAMMRTGSQSAVRVDREPPTQVGDVELAVRNAIAPAMREYNAELRRYIAATMEVLTRKIAAAEHRPAADLPPPAELPVAEPPAAPSIPWPLLAAIAAIALLPTIVLAVMHQRTNATMESLTQSNIQLTQLLAEQQAQIAALQQAARTPVVTPFATPAATTGTTETVIVPYGETPLSGNRLERLREMLDSLRANGFRGRVRASTYAGEFCLIGNGVEGYSIAADDLPMKRCDLVGNPFDENLTVAQRQSLPFANLVAGLPQDTGNALSVEVVSGGRNAAVPYPEGEARDKLTAGEWNQTAALNNRVEFVAESE